MIANGQPLALFGDQLFLDLDLSQANLPIGSRLQVGAVVLAVSPKPHNGCQKYRARFGADALRFISRPDLRPQNFRGIYLRVLTGGFVAVGDAVRVLERARPH
jgi:MOSC domain-containing protein YiiM